MRYLTLLFAIACSPAAHEAATDLDSKQRIDEATPEAFAVLALLNDASTTESLLDVQVGLDSRAARSLIAHRDGPDGLFGTPDDDLFDSIAEVDDQYYVGNSALNKLLNYAQAHGFFPNDDDIVGRWEGVAFTAEEVQLTLDLANQASFEELDDTVGLDSRAAGGIIDARPIADMNELADAYFVGSTALRDLRDYAVANAPTGGLMGDPCETSADCADDHVCLGEIAYGAGIFCVDDTMYDTFVWQADLEIPDNGTELVTSVDVQGLATVPVDVVLTIDVDHPRPSDLVLSIDNFNGYGETLWLNDSSPEAQIVVRAFPSDDMVNGQYNVRLTDTVAGEVGTLRGWDLYIVSNWD